MEFIKKYQNTWPYIVVPVNFLCCSCGFWNHVNAFSYGYSLSMIANGALALMVHRDMVKSKGANNFQRICHAGLSMAYGMRLGEYIFRRRSKSSYSSKWKGLKEKIAKASIWSRAMVVTIVSGLMSAYVLPLMYNFKSDEAKSEVALWVSFVGCGLAAVGLIMQWIADEQKLRHKETTGGCVMDGLYTYIRHPNYTGECIFHTGMYLCGFRAYSSWKEMGFSLIAPLVMNWVMVGATKRSDKKQLEKYGSDKLYKAWREKTWGMIPLIL